MSELFSASPLASKACRRPQAQSGNCFAPAVRTVEEKDVSKEHSLIWNGMAENTLVGLPFQESKEQLGAVEAAATHGQ